MQFIDIHKTFSMYFSVFFINADYKILIKKYQKSTVTILFYKR